MALHSSHPDARTEPLYGTLEMLIMGRSSGEVALDRLVSAISEVIESTVVPGTDK